MRNSLTDLNNHLFAQLERLGDETLTGEQLTQEISRAKSINDIANKVIGNAKVVLEAEKLKAEYGRTHFKAPKMIGVQEDV